MTRDQPIAPVMIRRGFVDTLTGADPSHRSPPGAAPMSVAYWVLVIIGALLLITGGRVNLKQPLPAYAGVVRIVGGIMAGAGLALLQG
jgi:hypothetical protein